jgi:hypothetical protein
MYARMASLITSPGKQDHLLRVIEEDVAPMVRKRTADADEVRQWLGREAHMPGSGLRRYRRMVTSPQLSNDREAEVLIKSGGSPGVVIA